MTQGGTILLMKPIFFQVISGVALAIDAIIPFIVPALYLEWTRWKVIIVLVAFVGIAGIIAQGIAQNREDKKRNAAEIERDKRHIAHGELLNRMADQFGAHLLTESKDKNSLQYRAAKLGMDILAFLQANPNPFPYDPGFWDLSPDEQLKQLQPEFRYVAKLRNDFEEKFKMPILAIQGEFQNLGMRDEILANSFVDGVAISDEGTINNIANSLLILASKMYLVRVS